MRFAALVRRPTAFLPIAMSLAAVALVVGYALVNGVQRQADEGWAAHTFQLLLAGQLPIVLFFAASWLPRAPRPAVAVLALQLAAVLAAFLPVYLLRW